MRIGLIGDSLTEGRPGVSFFKLLQKQYPRMTFVNLGKPGESVKSLHSRLTKKKLEAFDLAFLWIGVNDVYSKLLSVQAQPVAEDHEEFKAYYQKNLECVLSSSKVVITVTPAIVGEDLNNVSNQEIKQLNTLITSIAHKHTNVSILNLHTVFENHLSSIKSSDYISTKVLTVMKDVLFYKKTSRIDQLSKKRGLHLTLDGIHLNSKGAQIVADEYAAIIDQHQFIEKDALK
ncbi:SGNH/GDSL hydrolase family protein [Fictibacillus sp. 18YEL24]|uniref:SGNH/GDSL hydrolase family protein n=1 Tax=Fictibacillus sp. 18YEL24 TaxID=2745875 RepID=UPI0018CC84A6|nr:GDSL-type esterase/lipase family protein [Fictibacillus sp. 18YEL24]MBH0171583.1 SGNH/GDSL hydrolase family protein [Fictibacillus sp. 18YEL24]